MRRTDRHEANSPDLQIFMATAEKQTFVDINFVLGLLNRVSVGNVAEISEVYAASIFRIEVYRLVGFNIYTCFLNNGEGRG
jgi:hypothetical protein